MRIINDLNLKRQARELGVDVWHTPSFLFLVLGAVALVVMTATFYISRFYDSPEVVILSECFVVTVILVIGNLIIRSVEKVAELNKMKTEFVSIASHQLQAPLSAVKWETELLLSKFRKGLTERQLDNIETIETMIKRMSRLVSDLLNVARIDQGRLSIRKEKLNLVNLIKEIIKDFLPLAKAGNITLSFKSDKKIPLFRGDGQKIRLVLENILSNAIKYNSEKGKVETRLDRVGNWATISVKDNGLGIPRAQQKRIFDKFFRGDNVLKHQTEGTGLGLYIVKNVVEKSGGKVWFESAEGIGTIFYFSLPIKENGKGKNN